ncbi:hypothetical protein [Enterococcus caccae]|uniref:Uncharacterized protein n=1 Tax=Enterococcus caccae ATCC BAA-1240 TaxID=1158612 RepID=R3W756_9ENTE|nr:hypothetical protein [Enterococcus caccae]EOL43382.1 hypothetical protein UC7_02711 [Enterococcus caccae ATCC BAA-1240]EOT68218.1 hypothetical protein I580_00601 [Enterococcus caccae ATCC BAA-1240]OJG26915.1 hypothetical protein RU98_GL003006 [Enterococcus caccae]
MKKIIKIEEQKNDLLHQFLARLNNEIPYQENKLKMEEHCVIQYKLLVNMSFSANILYKGLDYANKVYNHVVKIEYSRLCKMIIKQELDSNVTEKILKKLKKAQNEMIVQSPVTTESGGIDIFYEFTGGNRKKYRSNRKAIQQMYLEIKQESQKSFYRYIKDSCKRKGKRIKEKKEYTLWLIKSYTWH